MAHGPLTRTNFSTDELDAMPPGMKLHIVMNSGAEHQAHHNDDGTWMTGFGAITSDTLSTALKGASRAIQHG